MWKDLLFALRSMARRPGFTCVAATTLALGIGASTAIFSVIDTVLLRPLPYEDPHRLVHLWETNPDRGWTQAEAAPANFLDWKEQSGSYSHLAAYSEYPRKLILGGQDEPRHVLAGQVSGDFFEVLGVRAVLGRTFRTEETWGDGKHRVVLAHALWQSLGADPSLVGRTLSLNGVEAEVLGILPAGFEFLDQPVQVWTPFSWSEESRQALWFRRAHFVRVIGRLRPEVTVSEAREELATIASRLEQEYPVTNTRMGAGLMPLHTWFVGDTRMPLLVLLGAVGLVLLIACANVANLLLARTTARLRELAVRRVLGAGRGRLIRQLLTENGLLAGLAALAGLVIAHLTLHLLVRLTPEGVPRLAQVALDGRVLLFTIALAAATTLVFGLAPALLGARAGAAVRAPRATGAERGESRLRRGLVAAEVALALVVVLATGLLTRSLWNLYAVDPGFEAGDLLVTEVGLPPALYEDAASVDAFFARLAEEIRSLPAIDEVSTTGMLPIDSSGWSGDLSVEGRGPGQHATEVRFAQIGPDYFATLRTPVVSGREFRPGDAAEAPPVAMINESMRELMFAGQDPLGVRIASEREPTESTSWATIVGVVRDIRQFGVDEEPRPQIFYPLAQQPDRVRSVLVRVDGDAMAMAPAVRAAVSRLDPRIPLTEVRTMEGVVDRSLARERFVLSLLLAFGSLAIALAGIGTWSVLTYTVARRRTEIGVRMAVGASGSEILRLVLGDGMRLVLAGLLAGGVGAMLLTQHLESMLFGVGTLDPASFAAAGMLLALVALIACVLPARAAARLDPATSLRSE